jgi:hypothetical protein
MSDRDDARDETPFEGTPRFAAALNQSIPPSPHRNFADEVLGMPPGEAALIREVRQAAGDEAERGIQRIEESRKINDAVLRHMLRTSGRASRADGDAP